MGKMCFVRSILEHCGVGVDAVGEERLKRCLAEVKQRVLADHNAGGHDIDLLLVREPVHGQTGGVMDEYLARVVENLQLQIDGKAIEAAKAMATEELLDQIKARREGLRPRMLMIKHP